MQQIRICERFYRYVKNAQLNELDRLSTSVSAPHPSHPDTAVRY